MGYSKDNSRVAKMAAEEALKQALRAEDGADSVEEVIAEVEQIALENKTKWLPAVATIALRNSTYPNPLNGDTVKVTGDSSIYRFQTGTGWVKTDEYNPTAIDNVTAQLADTKLNSVNVVNPLYLPAPYISMVGNSNYFNSTNGKWYVDSAKTILANDDSVGFASAVSYALNVNKPLYIPQKRFYVKTSTTIDKTISVFGDGYNSLIINDVPQGQALFNVVGVAGTPLKAKYCQFESFHIWGNVNRGGIAISLTQADDSRLERMILQENEIGVKLAHQNTMVKFSQCTFKSNKRGIDDSVHVNNADENYSPFITDCVFEGHSEYAIKLSSASARVIGCTLQSNKCSIETNRFIIIDNVYIEEKPETSYTMIRIMSGAYGSILTNIEFHGNAGIHTALEYQTTFKSSNLFFDNLDTGVLFTGTTAPTSSHMTGNTFNNVSASKYFVVGVDNILSTGLDGAVRNFRVVGEVSALGNPLGYLPIDATIKPKTSNVNDLGSTTQRYRYGHFQKVFFDTMLLNDGEITKVTASTPFVFNAGLDPKVNEAQNLGSASAYWNYVFGRRMYIKESAQFTATASAMNNNNLFVDSVDNKLKFKDSAGVIRIVNLT